MQPTVVDARNIAPYSFRVISPTVVISCASVSGDFVPGEKTTGAQSRKVETKVGCSV
jgi:hypothetical protein